MMNEFALFLGDLFTVITEFLLSEPVKYILFLFLFVMTISIISKLRRW